MINKRNTSWEERFDEKFSLPPKIGDATAGIGFVPSRRLVFEPYEELKSFIRQLLSQARKEGMIEGYSKGYNEAYLKRSNDLPASYQKGRKEGIEECEEIVKKQPNPFKKDWDYPYDQCQADILYDFSELKKKK